MLAVDNRNLSARCVGTIDIRDSDLIGRTGPDRARIASHFIAYFTALGVADQCAYVSPRPCIPSHHLTRPIFLALVYILLSFLCKEGTTNNGAGSWPDIVCLSLCLSLSFSLLVHSPTPTLHLSCPRIPIPSLPLPPSRCAIVKAVFYYTPNMSHLSRSREIPSSRRTRHALQIAFVRQKRERENCKAARNDLRYVCTRLTASVNYQMGLTRYFIK